MEEPVHYPPQQPTAPPNGGVPDASTADRADWAGWVKRLLGATVLPLVLIATLNFVVNPAGYYPTRFTVPLTANDAVLKMELLRQAKERPVTLILGSSKSMRLAPHTVQRLTGKPSFNAATSAAVPSDMLEMARFAFDEARAAPSLVLIGVDVEMLHNGTRPVAHMPPAYQRAQALLSLDHTRESLRSLRYWISGSYPPLRRTFASDGSLREPVLEADAARGVDVFERDLPALVANYNTMWSTYTALSPAESRALEDLVLLCKKRGSAVLLFLTATHPRLEEALRSWHYERRKVEVRRELERLAKLHGAQFVDLSDIRSFGGDLNDFYDGTHVKDRNAERMIQRLLTQDAVQ